MSAVFSFSVRSFGGGLDQCARTIGERVWLGGSRLGSVNATNQCSTVCPLLFGRIGRLLKPIARRAG